VNQLTKNYAVLRTQTFGGFLVGAVTMLLGGFVIIAGAYGQVFGLASNGVNLVTIAGVITNFISGTAIYFFKLSFDRLNVTSDRLLQTWITIAAIREAE